MVLNGTAHLQRGAGARTRDDPRSALSCETTDSKTAGIASIVDVLSRLTRPARQSSRETKGDQEPMKLAFSRATNRLVNYQLATEGIGCQHRLS